MRMRLERRGIVVVAVHIAQEPAQLFERGRIEAAMLLQAVLRPGLELVEIPAGLGHADDRHVEMAAFHHRLQRREDLLVGQVAGGAEENQASEWESFMVSSLLLLLVFSRWPPN